MTAQDDKDLEEGKMPLLDHLIELRQRLIYAIASLLIAFIPCVYFSQKIYNFLAAPLAEVLAQQPGGAGRLIQTDLLEGFITQVRVGLWTAVCVAFPIIAVQLWLFVAPGLYKNERRAFLPFLFATPVLFIMGGSLAYFVIFPTAWKFFASFQQFGGIDGITIELMPKMSDYFTLVLHLIFAFGFAFQMPVLLTLLARVGILSSAALASKRRYAIVANVAVAAVLTPPDLFSMISLALPMLALYELSIFACRLIEKQRAAAEAAEAASANNPS